MVYKQQKVIAYSSGGWKSKIRMPAQSVSGADPLLGCRSQLLLIPSHGGRGKGSLWASFIRALIPFMRASSLMTWSLPKGPTSYTITLGVRNQHMNLGRPQSMYFSKHYLKMTKIVRISQKGTWIKDVLLWVYTTALGLGFKYQHKPGQILKRDSCQVVLVQQFVIGVSASCLSPWFKK